MVKASILSPTPPSSVSLSPTNENQSTELLIKEQQQQQLQQQEQQQQQELQQQIDSKTSLDEKEKIENQITINDNDIQETTTTKTTVDKINLTKKSSRLCPHSNPFNDQNVTNGKSLNNNNNNKNNNNDNDKNVNSSIITDENNINDNDNYINDKNDDKLNSHLNDDNKIIKTALKSELQTMANSESIVVSSSTSMTSTTSTSEESSIKGNESVIENCDEIERNNTNEIYNNTTTNVDTIITTTTINTDTDTDTLIMNMNMNDDTDCNKNDNDNNDKNNNNNNDDSVIMIGSDNNNRNDIDIDIDNDECNNNPSINKTLYSLPETENETETIVANNSSGNSSSSSSSSNRSSRSSSSSRASNDDDKECSVKLNDNMNNQNDESVIVTAASVTIENNTATTLTTTIAQAKTIRTLTIGTTSLPSFVSSTPSISPPQILYATTHMNPKNSIQLSSNLSTTTTSTTTLASTLQHQPYSIPHPHPHSHSHPHHHHQPPPTLIALTPVTVSQIPQLSPPIQQAQVVPPPSQPTSSGPSLQSAHSPHVPQPPPPQHPSAPHHHIFPVHVISIPQPPPPGSAAAAVTAAWPIIETPIYVDSNGEARPYCPAHSPGPGPREHHRVLLQLDTGVSMPVQMGGKRKMYRDNGRGRYSSNHLQKDTNKTCPTTVQMVSQNRPPPIPVPVQVPQGQVMQQYVNESGTLTHVVLSPTQYQQLHTGQGGVPHIHAPFITTNGTASHFYGPLPGGFPGPGGGPHFHPIPGGHLPPQQMSHSPHSPSPPNNYHKDERTQRQHTKLLRKLDQKREMNSALSTPAHSPSPRKNELNGIRKTSRNGASSVGTSEDGEESSSVPDEEDDCQTIIEQLSAVQKPEVTDILSRSAMVRWKAPPTTENLINSRDLRYDVLLSDRGKEGKYKKILEYGESYMCMIRDLRPGQEYFVCVQVHHEKLVGCASEPTVFVTPPCEPDQPSPPKLIARSKYSLQLRWNAPTDNGSHISNYILEYDKGKRNKFTEIVKTKGKQYTIAKLEPSTQYCFRMAAVNECGPSMYSEVVSFSTSGNPPLAPRPPKLKKATSTSLLLTWEKRAQDERFVLQSYYDAYASIKYDGPDTSYEVIDLDRACSYEFKLRADNEFGSSPWSSRVTFATTPDRPGKPSKPQVKGKIHATQVKVTWNPPEDKGGDSSIFYILEISSGRKFETKYTGHETEATCTRLSPGTTYQIRVASKNAGGVSDYSDICTVTTEILLPGQLLPPYCGQPLTPYDVLIRWDIVPINFKSEGTSISHFDVKVNGPNFTDTIVFSGDRQDCVIKDLLPGEKYSACVRGVNRLGAGPWSVPFHFSSGAAIPSAPEISEVILCSATHVTVTWKEPNTNGAPIIEYQLERLVSNTDNGSAIDDTFYTCYTGIHTTADIHNLKPFTNYCFRVCALNSAGTSSYSPIVLAKTPASVPSAPQMQNYEITATEVTLHWSQPESNGPDILHYVIEYNDKSVTTEKNITDFTIKNLLPETSYKFKVQAVNEIGAGQFSNQLKLITLPPPPKPPKLKCTGIGHNFIKLKWDDEKNLLDSKRKGDLINYYVEMYNTSAKEFQSVYSGMNLMCKVNKLQEQTSYKFKIYCETDDAGIGDYSEEYVFKTSPTLPNSIKPPRIAGTNLNMSCCCSNSTTITNTNIHQTNHNNNNTNSNSISNNSKIANGANAQNLVNNCSQNSAVIGGITGTRSVTSHIHCFKNNNILTVEWQHSKNTFKDPIEYILQCSCGKENEYVEIYRGPQTRFTIDNLESGSIYLFRVCPVRVTKTNGDILGSFTPPLRYQMPPQHRTSINCLGAATSVAANSMLTSCTSMSNTNHRSSHNHHHYHNNHGHHHHHNHHHHDIGNSCSDALLHNNDVGNDYTTLTKGTASGPTGILSGIVGTGTLQRCMGRLTAIYTNRKRLSDQEKAVLWMLSFILATICFASIVKMFMR